MAQDPKKTFGDTIKGWFAKKNESKKIPKGAEKMMGLADYMQFNQESAAVFKTEIDNKNTQFNAIGAVKITNENYAK